jgi:hypothetical protein
VADGVQTTWGQSLPAPLLDLLRGAHPADDRSDTWPHASNSNGTLHPLTGAAGDLAASLCRLVGGADPLLGALALAALSDIDLPRARACVADLTSSGADLSNGTAAGHGLMAEVVAALDGQVIPPASRADNAGLTLIVLSQSEAQPPRSFNQDRVSIGGSPDNDVVIAGLAVAPHHAVICRSGLAVEVRRADPTAAFTIDGTGFAGDRTVIQSGARLGLLTDGVLGPVVVIEWAPNAADITLEPRSTLRKLLWLSQADIFRDVGLHALAELAGLARAWHCGRGTWLCRQGDASGELFVLATGTADVFVRHEGREQPTGQLRPGALVDDIGLITGAPHSVSVCISSATAHVVTINALRLRALMERDAGLSLAMLGAVATASPPEDGPPMMQLAEHA